jgi:redox-sensitive bicupin YhaK (pirin superfamily)
MIEHRPLATLGGGNHGWLKARHHFAFAGVGNPKHRAIGSLHVWNDDSIAPHSGFPLHAHRDVEIVTYVRDGAITHEDSLGNKGRTEAGSVQVMSAGRGIRHSEFNAEDEQTRIFQIWLTTRTPGSDPRWASARFPRDARGGRLAVLASGNGAPGSLPIDADADVLGATLRQGETITHALNHGAKAYLVPAVGRVLLNGIEVAAGDGAAVEDESQLEITSLDDTQIVLVTLY